MTGAGNDEALENDVFSLRTTIKLAVGAWADTGWAPHELLHTLVGCHAEEVDRITFLAVNRDGFVYLFQSLFCIAGGEYEEVLGNLWVAKGEILADGLLTLVKLNPLHFALNSLFQGTDRAEFEMHVN